MNITFLIGNGFDLNLGLNTRYTDFLKEYINITTDDSDVITYFKSAVLKDIELWSGAEEAFGIVTKQFEDEKYSAEDYCECHEDFCNKLAEYLSREEEKINYSNLSESLYKGFGRGILKYRNGFREGEGSAISQTENTFGGGYVFNFINFNYTKTLDNCVTLLREKSGELGRRTYANTTGANQVGKVLHIHGTLNKDMVLGVNDISQILEPSLFNNYDEEYINEVIKPKTNEINEENADKKAFELLKTSDLIYIYGMSTGLTDKLWWERICELMSTKKNLHLIIYKYDAPEDGRIRRKFRLYVKDVKKAFTAYSSLDENVKRDIENRIHIDTTNIFDGLEGIAKSQENLSKKELVKT